MTEDIYLTQKQQWLEEDPSRIGYVGPPDQPPCQPRGPCPQGYLHGLNLNLKYIKVICLACVNVCTVFNIDKYNCIYMCKTLYKVCKVIDRMNAVP